MPKDILSRTNELELLRSFIQPSRSHVPRTLLIQGAASTGKSLTLLHHLKKIKVKYSWIQCDECVSPKILWKRIIEQVSIDSGKVKKDEYLIETTATSSFQGFLKVFIDFFKDNKYNKLHYIILDRADQIMENGETVFANFVKLQEITQVYNVSVIFVTNRIPKSLITQCVPTIIFPNYTSDEVVHILSQKPLLYFPSNVHADDQTTQNFWNNYVKLIIESFWSYTTDIRLLRRILRKLWPEFIRPITNGENSPDEFFRVYRKNMKLLTTEYAIDDTSPFQDSSESQVSSNLPVHSKYILIASYLASFNEQKRDWLLFSKLRDFHRGRRRAVKKAKVEARHLAAAYFDLERLLAITHAIYTIETVNKLPTDVDFFTQISNLNNLNLLSRQGSDILSTQTKWRCNANEDFIRGIAHDLGFPLDNYLE